MYKVSAESIKENHKRITYLRVIVLLCLAGIGGGGGFLVFYLLDNMEKEICKVQFTSVADLIQASITANFESKVKIGHGLSKAFGVGCPDSDSWPNCPYDVGEFNSLNNVLEDNIRISGFAPFVYPDKIASFENFSKHHFQSNPQYYPAATGYSKFGFGIFGINGSRYHDTGNSTYGSPFKITVPIMLIDRLPQNYVALLFNLHSEKRRGAAIDNLLSCQNKNLKAIDSCGQSSLTDMIHTLIDSKFIQTTAIYTPIFPRLNQSNMVGIAYVYVYWDEIMNITIPSSFPGIVVVVKSDTSSISYASQATSSISYAFKGGKAISLGDGDKHNPDYDNMRESVSFTSKFVDSGSAQYEINIYPTASFCEYYHSEGPILVLIGLICMMVITGALFCLYDYFMKSESLLRKFLLESKRLFVRFISHELRTPLNAVSLGLNLIESDLNNVITHPRYSKSLNPELTEQLKMCVQSLHEASENANTAIVVLNDMLQYDKIESKSLQCECIENNIWEVIRHACNELSLQAKASRVTLTMKLQIDVGEEDESWRVNASGTLDRLKSAIVVGDPIKLGQVIRNLISNALKFSPPGGQVIVNGFWVPNGLAQTTMPKCTGSYQRFGSVRIEVIDEGPGITQQGKETLFQEGVQLNPNQLQSGQGSGLGLWIAKGITNIHGGSIGVECEEVGKGSMFYVELPLVDGCESSPHPSQSRSPSQYHVYSQCQDGDGNGDAVGEKRVWSWSDPRNNIDHKSIITPTSKRVVLPFASEDIVITSSQKVVPLDYSITDKQDPPTLNQEILTQKQILPEISSEVSQTNQEQKSFAPSNPTSPISTLPRPMLRILVVDDAKSIRKLLSRALANQGHICDCACDGQECVDMVIKQPEEGGAPVCPYDLILMDSEMPVMNGPTATKIIRSMGFSQLIILGVTGNVLQEDVEMFLNHGVDAVLGKPMSVETMWKEYDRIVKEKSQISKPSIEQLL